MNIVILAAGLGKRMHSTLPKALHPVAGRPMLAHVLDTARETARQCRSEARIIVVVGHGAGAVRSAFASQPDLRFVEQQPQLGTGHAVLQAAPELREDAVTLVLYGDVPLLRARTLVGLVEAAAGQLGVLTVRLGNPSGYGRILRDPAGHVRAIVEERDADDEQRRIEEVNTGILVAPTGPLRRWLAGLSNANAQGEYYLTDVVGSARAQGMPVVAWVASDPDEALGVNSKVQLAHLERVAQRRAAEALLEAGVTLADPQRLDVRGEVETGSDVFIDVGCIFEGKVRLGDGVRVGPYCVLREAQIGAGTVLQAFSHVDGARVGRGVQVGPYARLRPGAELDDDVHVGNFVEIKAARLEQGAKANHLAYIGDARVGARSNVGAGTIFANYDGARKHRSDVGADVHIGSNSVLIAPTHVGDGATIGAGSTVSREVPGGTLTVARARQVTVANWKRPRKKD